MTKKPVILMLGDSLTEFWRWRRLSEQADVSNCGIAGDTSQGLLHRLDIALSVKPKVIFLQIGINDISMGVSPKQVCDNQLLIWRELTRKAPSAKLVVCSLMPLRQDSFCWVSDFLTTERVKETNKLLKAAADQNGLSYIDLFSKACNDQEELEENMTLDGVHLTEVAYDIWEDALKAFLDANPELLA
ncbi:MAG: GDSL-type esterase/lipase family protein [Deltaproteobacteria bacterium]|jgi:lysophospholipase L1-like esterase|nr:GDSL-type esterase/lipase family protein [Deltaproteobacteria bacterium]